jgi:transposase-like protein
MSHHRSARNPLFHQRWFVENLIITCVRWYLGFKLSNRDLPEFAIELGVSVAASTILRWVVRCTLEFDQRWQAYECPVGDSSRVDETYLKVRGQWLCLYRAVDKQDRTVESYLRRTRGVVAAKAFFRKAFRHHSEQHVMTLDGFEPSHAALRRMGMNNEFNNRFEGLTQIRSCQYLNNIVKRDQRLIKRRVGHSLEQLPCDRYSGRVLTHIIYAFANVSTSGESLSTNAADDHVNFPQLLQLKQQRYGARGTLQIRTDGSSPFDRNSPTGKGRNSDY